MAMTKGETAATDVVDELVAWLEANWEPELSVAEWWERLGLAGWAAPSLPENAFGKGLSRGDAVRVQQAISRFGALGAPAGLGLSLAAPTIATHGTQEQIDLYVREIVTGQKAWCQLFSEPGAGSDLAGLTTRAVADGEEWIVNGQKVWTSGGQTADLGMLMARTDFDVPKHQGITWFAIDMHQPGVEVRPLREMTGRALFNEVFLSDARVPNDAVVGGLNKGWAVGNTTLMFERGALGAGGGEGTAGGAQPGTVAGNLQRRALRVLGRGAQNPGGRLPGLRIAEVPSNELTRISGNSNLNTFRDGWRVLRTLARECVGWEAPTAGARPESLRRVKYRYPSLTLPHIPTDPATVLGLIAGD